MSITVLIIIIGVAAGLITLAATKNMAIVGKMLLNLLLIVVSWVLYQGMLVFGLVYATISLLWRGRFLELSQFYYDVAITHDMSGGVTGQYPLNDMLIHPDGVRFGYFGITISKILALNQAQGSWYRLAMKIGKGLDWLDPGHLKDSKV